MLVTEFVVRHEGEGPAVTARRQGTSWQISWPGRDKESSGLVVCDYAEAQRIAAGVAEQVADLEPYRAEVARRQRDIGAWVEAQREAE